MENQVNLEKKHNLLTYRKKKRQSQWCDWRYILVNNVYSLTTSVG
ncbi:hypothetical protein THOE12_20441 [Vibrio rotiferianus]|nr:hypothetical protein THOE12_20441 [Vibrio rotiferianus]